MPLVKHDNLTSSHESYPESRETGPVRLMMTPPQLTVHPINSVLVISLVILYGFSYLL
jgi:hypothetical protein